MPLFYGKRLNLNQPEKGYRPSIDAILLSAAIHKGKTILDVGCGIGTAGLCLKVRRPEITLTGIDIQEENIHYAAQNAQQNNMDARFIEGNIKTLRLQETFDHVISNPPFYEEHKINTPQDPHKLLSNVLQNITLQEWVNFCIKHSKDYVTLIHLPDMLPILLSAFDTLSAIKIFPIWSKGKAERIIIQGKKKSKAPLQLLQGLTLRATSDDSQETKEAKEIFQNSGALNFGN